MPCSYGVGYHRLFVIDFALHLITSMTPRKFVGPSAHRLNTQISHVLTK